MGGIVFGLQLGLCLPRKKFSWKVDEDVVWSTSQAVREETRYRTSGLWSKRSGLAIPLASQPASAETENAASTTADP